jgi:hypothetical protein
MAVPACSSPNNHCERCSAGNGGRSTMALVSIDQNLPHGVAESMRLEPRTEALAAHLARSASTAELAYERRRNGRMRWLRAGRDV